MSNGLGLGSKLQRVVSRPPSEIAAAKKRSLTSTDAFVFPADQPDEFNFTIVSKLFQYSKQGSSKLPKTTYVLPMPSAISDSTSLEYSETSLGAIGGRLAAEAQRIAAVADVEGAEEAGRYTVKRLAALGQNAYDSAMRMDGADKLAALNAAFGGMLGDQLGGVAGALVGSVPNPHKTVFFKGVNLKNHQFSFNLFPANAKESDHLKRMLNQLRKESLPDHNKALGQLALTYPHQFDLSIMSRGGEHTMLFKPAFMTSINVNYTPHGAAFMEDGMPAGVTLSMSFSEMDIWRSSDYPTSDTSQAGIPATPTRQRQGALDAARQAGDAGGPF